MLETFAQKQRFALGSFYVSCLGFTLAVAPVERVSSAYRLSLLSVACLAGFCGTYSLCAFFKTTDEFRQDINRRGIEFAFVGSLVASIAIPLLQSLGIPRLSPYALPAVMVALWSIGLFFFSRRFE
jgi:hypothetical protein